MSVHESAKDLLSGEIYGSRVSFSARKNGLSLVTDGCTAILTNAEIENNTSAVLNPVSVAESLATYTSGIVCSEIFNASRLRNAIDSVTGDSGGDNFAISDQIYKRDGRYVIAFSNADTSTIMTSIDSLPSDERAIPSMDEMLDAFLSLPEIER